MHITGVLTISKTLKKVNKKSGVGGQYKISGQIVEAGGGYLFSLKGNRGTLEEDVELYFRGIDFNRPEAGGTGVHGL
jgi:hypothetical protein